MANPHKGEVEFEAAGATYKLSFSANAFCELEEALDTDTQQLVEMISSGDMVKLSTLRIVFWKGLEDHQEGMTLDETKRLLRHLKPAEMGTLLGRALLAAMPPVEEGGARPPVPGSQNGTGPASIESGPASAGRRKTSGSGPHANSR